MTAEAQASIDGSDAPSMAAETQALREAYAALNRNDVSGFVESFDPEIERIEPDDFPGGGTYHGIDAVKAHVAKGRSTWAEGSCEPERFLIAGNKIVVFLVIRVRLKDRSEFLDGSVADVYAFRNGKAIQFRTFANEQQALEYVGMDASEAIWSRETVKS
ncbi:MAG: nuclear transport factor 2 family protein [Pyrinomonadaceae bacterium]